MFSLCYIIKLTQKTVLCTVLYWNYKLRFYALWLFCKTEKPLYTFQIKNIRSKKCISIMQLWNSNFQCHNGYYSIKALKVLRKIKTKIAIIGFHESTVLHNFLWWLSFKTEKCTNSKETAVLHNTEKIEDRGQYYELQTLISVRKVRFSFLLTLVQSIFLF